MGQNRGSIRAEPSTGHKKGWAILSLQNNPPCRVGIPLFNQKRVLSPAGMDDAKDHARRL